MTGGLVIGGAQLAFDGQPILAGIDLSVAPETVHGLIGPNGAGKSSLMRASLGLIPLDAGSVTFGGEDFLALPRRQRARISAFVDQSTATDLRLSGREAVLLGRIPFQSLWQAEPSPADQAAADAALLAVGMAGLADRQFDTLSGGEQQRLQIARALAQEPRLLLLDEPTNHLDIHAQLAILDLLRARAAAGLTVLLALHDLNLAASFCDTISVIAGGRCVATGTPEAVLTPELLARVYGVTASVLAHPQSGRPLIAYDRGAAPAQ